MNINTETWEDGSHLEKLKAIAPSEPTEASNKLPQLVEKKRGAALSVLQAASSTIWRGDSEEFLSQLPKEPLFDLVVTSPPYNIGKSYESKSTLSDYMAWQERIIDEIIPRIKDNGSLCWQVGNFVEHGEITPLDFEFAPIFKKHKLLLRNRIIWTFGHGLHTRRRFSGRYEVVLWYTKSDSYYFDLDPVRVPSKYPSKRHFKGPRKGELSGNPLGKNPEDVWSIPNVKSNHIEKQAALRPHSEQSIATPQTG
jgi:adenine-specific DNA-methyltransferase